MSALWLVRLVVAATTLALPFFGVSFHHSALRGSLAIVSAQTPGPASPQDIEDQPPIVDEDVNDQGDEDGHESESENEAGY